MGTISIMKNRPRTWLTRNERLDILSSYIKAGFHLTPLNWLEKPGVCSCHKGAACDAAGKHPRFRGWQNPQSPGHISTSQQLDKKFKANEKANWGVVTGQVSGIFVLDIDTRHDGHKTLQRLEEKYGTLPPTLTATTGGGGKHILFKYPTDGTKINNDSQGRLLGEGIDIRSDRGQIAVCPSRHKSGNFYKWDSDVGTTAIAEAPAWLLEKITYQEPEAQPLTPEQIAEFNRQHQQMRETGTGARRYVEVALKAEVESVLLAGQGRRNAILNAAAYNLGRYIPTGLLTHQEVYQELLYAANAIGLGITEADATILSGLAGGARKPKLPPERAYQDEFGDLANITLEHGDNPAVRKMSEVEEREFDRMFGEMMAFDLELQKDPVAYQKHIEEYQAKYAAEDAAISAACRRDAEERRALRERLDAINWTVSNNNIPFHRCEKCPPNKSHRPCPTCAKKLGVTRGRPADVPCKRGGCFMVQSKDPAKFGNFSAFRPKCCMWGCPKCGYDNECDHLIHLQMFSEWLNDLLDSPKLCIPSHDIEESAVKEVDIQPGCWKAIIPDAVRRRYSTKLSKMGVYFVADYVGEDNYAFYCFLPLGFKPERLNYKPLDVNNKPLPAVVAERIPFSEFQRQHRLHLSNAGRYIKLSKSDWDTCDAAPGTRLKHVAVSYCRALRMPKRMITNNQNTFVGRIALDDQTIMAACDEFGATHSLANTRDIDRSHRRGLTQCLLKFWRFEFPPAASRERIEAFIARLTGRDEIIEYAEEKAQQYTGSSCLRYPLVT